MNKCKFEKRLNAYQVSEISNAEKTVIENHLKTCKICQNSLQQLKEEDDLITDFLSSYKEEKISNVLQEKLMAIPSQTKQVSKFSQAIIQFSVAASFILIFTLGIIMGNEIVSTNSNIAFAEESLVDIESLYSLARE